MSDLIVIGGGLAGLSCAYTASRRGARVTVIDREDAGQATAAGAGILTPGTTRNAGDAWWQAFAFPAVRYYDELLNQLAEDGESDTGHSRTGLLHVATSDEELARLPDVEATALRSRSLGAPLVDDVSLIDGDEARRLFPALGDVPGAVHVTGACRIDGRLLMGALRRAAVKRGARLLNEGAAAITVSGGRVSSVELLGGRTEPAAAVVVAAGAWSGGLLSPMGVSVPVMPQRGQILHLRFQDLETGHWPTVMGFHSHYMLTFPGGRVVAGATREADSGFEVRVTAGGAHEVLTEALRIAPGLGRARLDEFRVGLRPATPDGRPVLGRTPVEGAYALTGHGPSGLQLAPYSGARVAALALDATNDPDLEPFSISRFAVGAKA